MARSRSQRDPAVPQAAAPVPAPDENAPPPVGRREAIVAGVIVLLAAVLRLWDIGSVAVEHFDEGVYASNIFFSAEEGGRYPFRYLYAPPLLPAAIEWCVVFLGPDGVAPFLPGLACGVGLVAVAWRACRECCGPAAGLTAAGCIAVDPFLILYSRTALTDVPATFLMLAAVWAFARSVRLGTWRSMLLAGGLTGLAWWMKYNGWLPLAICGAGGAADVVCRFLNRDDSWRARGRRVLRCWAVMIGVAGICFVPLVVGLQPHGGYAAVAENHAQYVVGFAGWAESAARQVGNLSILDPAFGPWVPFAVGLVGAAVSILLSRGDRLPAWLVAAWLIGLTVAVPFYTPFPRLLVPWRVACWLGVGAGIASADMPRRRVASVFLILVVAATSGFRAFAADIATYYAENFVMRKLMTDAPERLRPRRRSMADVASAVLDAIESHETDGRPDAPARFIVYVYGDPALFYYLSAGQDTGRYAVFTANDEDLNGTASAGRIPTYLAIGPQAVWNRAGLEEEIAETHGPPIFREQIATSRFVALNRRGALAGPIDAAAVGPAIVWRMKK